MYALGDRCVLYIGFRHLGLDCTCYRPKAYILAGDNIYDIYALFQANGAKICALNFDTNCRRRQNMPSTLKQIVAENPTDLEVQY